jgi:hypothetical protein
MLKMRGTAPWPKILSFCATITMEEMVVGTTMSLTKAAEQEVMLNLIKSD